MSTKTHTKRVSFSHDHDNLLKPHPTICVTFDITLSPSELILKGHVFTNSVPVRKPLRRRLFGSLVDLCATLDNATLTRDCTKQLQYDEYDDEYNEYNNDTYKKKFNMVFDEVIEFRGFSHPDFQSHGLSKNLLFASK
jgi:hypothetical protein